MLTAPFPEIDRDPRKDDSNPGIQLFGRRFFSDQQVPELLVEFLLVASSRKYLGDGIVLPEEQALPTLEQLADWPEKAPLEYAPKARLNLKLFSFLGVSNLGSRHATHREHYRSLLTGLRSRIYAGDTSPDDVLKTLENLFLGMQGAGGNRTWCAQSFVPICRELVAGETIWNDSAARRDGVADWQSLMKKETYQRCFSTSQHKFLSRGGELLYLQLCNVLRRADQELWDWSRDANVPLSPGERSVAGLHESLSQGLARAFGSCPPALGKLASFIDSEVDPATAERSDMFNGKRRKTACGWCPRESWKEGLLFAVELSRICAAAMDPIDRLDVLSTACAMQELRSLCAQSARYAPERNGACGPLGYAWLFSDPEGTQEEAKQISRRCLRSVERLIHEAIRHPEIRVVVEKSSRNPSASYKQADTHYGHKLFLTVGKRLGLVIPRRGQGARFVLNDGLLRFLVLSLIRPGERVSYQTFKDMAFAHFGMAFDDETIGSSCAWFGQPRLGTLGGQTDGWLLSMLDAAGVLQRLSDSCALVRNPYLREEDDAQ